MLFNKNELVKLSIAEAERKRNAVSLSESKILEEQNKRRLDMTNIRDIRESKVKVERDFVKFVSEVKQTLLAECMYSLIGRSYGYQTNKVQADVIKNNLVNSFIQEQGYEKLISKFRNESYVLSEFARVIDKYTGIIIEKADKNDTSTFIIDQEDKDNFYDEIKTDDSDEVVSAIKMRVSDSIDVFVNSNIKQKEELKEILRNSKEKIDATRNETVKESYELLAKKAITNLKEKRKINVLESMIYSLSESCLKDESLKAMYSTDNKLNMDSIVESATVMYSFLEMLNTAKIHNVNEAYIIKVLDEIKR